MKNAQTMQALAAMVGGTCVEDCRALARPIGGLCAWIALSIPVACPSYNQSGSRRRPMVSRRRGR